MGPGDWETHRSLSDQAGAEGTDEITKKIKDYDTMFLKIENDINKINKNLEKVAKRREVKELENLLSLYNPLKSTFVTKSDIEKMLEERMR